MEENQSKAEPNQQWISREGQKELFQSAISLVDQQRLLFPRSDRERPSGGQPRATRGHTPNRNLSTQEEVYKEL